MNSTVSQAQTLARPVITGLIVLNLIYALCVSALLLATMFAPWVSPGWPWKALGFRTAQAHPLLPLALQSVAFLGIVAAVLVHLVLRRLRAIVDTVRDGDPFITENARRLTAIAWLVLAGEAIRLPIVGIAGVVSTAAQPVDFGDAFSFTPLLAVLLLFVLAGVFAQGARMRADLEGTV